MLRQESRFEARSSREGERSAKASSRSRFAAAIATGLAGACAQPAGGARGETELILARPRLLAVPMSQNIHS
jgi:hypothetical protein